MGYHFFLIFKPVHIPKKCNEELSEKLSKTFTTRNFSCTNFVHKSPYQTTVVCCNPIFHQGSLPMDHLPFSHIFLISVGLAQARLNNTVGMFLFTLCMECCVHVNCLRIPIHRKKQ